MQHPLRQALAQGQPRLAAHALLRSVLSGAASVGIAVSLVLSVYPAKPLRAATSPNCCSALSIPVATCQDIPSANLPANRDNQQPATPRPSNGAIIQPLKTRPSLSTAPPTKQLPNDNATPSPLLPQQPAQPQAPISLDHNPSPESAAGNSPASPLQPTTEIASAATAAEFQWSPPRWLISRLEQLQDYSSTAAWATSVVSTVKELQTLTSLTDSRAEAILARLVTMIDDSQNVVDRAMERKEFAAASTVVRIHYDLSKSVDLWRSCLALARHRELRITDASQLFRQASHARIALPTLDPSWSEYLLLDKFSKLMADPSATDFQKRSQARATLARLTSPALKDEQVAYLNQTVGEEFVEYLRMVAIEDVDLPTLIESLDIFQETKSGVHAAWIGREYQNLLWRPEREANELAQAIDTHLRNANLRLAISDRWLNRLLPPVQEAHEPVAENVFGAQVFGQSRIANRLQFRFIPDNSRIRIMLESVGRVVSSTEATKSGVTVRNHGNARFHALRQIVIGNRGIETEATEARSNVNNQVVGIRSNMDGIPLLGPLTRRIAEKEIQAQQPAAKQHVEQKLASTVKQRFEEETNAQLYQLQTYLVKNLIEPLTMLDLEPVPIQMRSTEDRMIMRYRLAGRDQLAANTARPAGLDNSLMSMQIHESVINNLINRLELNGNEFTLKSFRDHLGQILGVQPIQGDSHDDEEIEAKIRFAPFDPIRVSFENDRILVEFNLKHLQIGKGKKWENITASAKYKYTIDGLRVTLEQDGEGVMVSGRKFNIRDQIAVRSIFTKIFRNDFAFSVLPPAIVDKTDTPMQITQFDIIDGWVGISIDDGPVTHPHVSPHAQQPSSRSTLSR